MKSKLLIVLAVLLCLVNNALAQPVAYSLQDGGGQHLAVMVFDYKKDGYGAIFNGKRATMKISGNTAVTTIGVLTYTTVFDGSYYHNRFGQSRTTPVTTSFGDKGFLKMFYAGMTPDGRLYYEDLWLNGRLFDHSETVIDDNNQLVRSVGTDADGVVLRLERM